MILFTTTDLLHFVHDDIILIYLLLTPVINKNNNPIDPVATVVGKRPGRRSRRCKCATLSP
jgi:hypothetical protein